MKKTTLRKFAYILCICKLILTKYQKTYDPNRQACDCRKMSTALHRRAMILGIPCMISLDTANALMDILGSRFSLQNTELVDINHMRR